MSKVKQTNRICIIMPAHNERSVISDVIGEIKKYSIKCGTFVDIVVVNDSSTDDTAEVARKAGSVVINHIINTGAGGATATGLSYANQNGYDIAATMDADGQHSCEDVFHGINLLMNNEVDLYVGSRLISGEGMSRVKIIGNKGLTLFTKVLFGINVTDSQSGLRIFSKQALQKLRWKTSGYEFCSEMLWRAKQKKLIISEYPIKVIYTDYSKTKGQSNWNGPQILKLLIRQRVVELFE